MVMIISKYKRALEKQVHESVVIEIALATGGDKKCLNSKSQWEGSKIPGLKVLAPKGMVDKVVKEGPWKGLEVTGKESLEDEGYSDNEGQERQKILHKRKRRQEEGRSSRDKNTPLIVAGIAKEGMEEGKKGTIKDIWA